MVRSKKFTNELEPTVEQTEPLPSHPPAFAVVCSLQSLVKKWWVFKGEDFNALVEFAYCYFKSESFSLT